MLSEQADIWIGPTETSSLHKMVKYLFNLKFCLVFFSRYFPWHKACVFHFLWSKTPTLFHGELPVLQIQSPPEGKGISCPYLSSKTSFALLDFALSVAWAEAGGQLEELFRTFSCKGNPCHDYKKSICCTNSIPFWQDSLQEHWE